ncbi:GGDEF domain-containing protein [Massilia oculi]|uniref:diguanylate cyclase n=1 Tax=Massilia hydrophila TaxID=3044279 RepID=A0ABS7Y8E1_9BURK|nr:GGDEF domain-containing protein [Massilia oculi]MCA1854675.1 GGDEF domain-containing protein [Massilia oculi]
MMISQLISHPLSGQGTPSRHEADFVRQRTEAELARLLPRVGPGLALLVVLYTGWDLLLDPANAVQSGLTRLLFAALAAPAFWASGLPWTAQGRACWAYWMLSAGVILAMAQLEGGLSQGSGGILIGLFLIPFIASSSAGFLAIALPPTLLLFGCLLRGPLPELASVGLTYGAGLAVAFLQMRITSGLRAASLAVQARLEWDASHDALTRCPNRAWLQKEAAHAFDRARREGAGLAFAMIDIDHFKRVNDRFGHAAGDQVLKGVAEACQRAVGQAGHFGRLGGEEFLCIFPGASEESALIHGERIRAEVEAAAHLLDGETLKVTVSVGLGCLSEHHADWEQLLAGADEAMYAAKQEGRNRVKSACSRADARSMAMSAAN